MDCVDDGARVLEADAFADCRGAAAPAGVDQPDARLVLAHLFREQLGIFARMPNQERPAEARRERRLRLLHAHFGAGDLRGVTADEVIHCVRGRKRRDRRQHAEGVASKEDHIGRMTGHAGDLGVLNELDRIRAARVLRDARVGVIDDAIFIEHDVLQHGAEAQRLENIRLAFRRKIDRLGVAAAFDVEDAVVAPAVLVVADEMTFRIGGERRFARAAQAEEQGGRAALFVRGGRTMHRKHAALGREIIRDGEDAFLHLAGVFGAEDDQFLVLEAEIDARRRTHATGQAIRGKRAGVDDDEVRLAEAGELVLRRTDQHGVHEERVIRPRADHADFDAVFRVPTGEAVEAIKPLASVEIIERALAIDLERLLVARDVDRAPPDIAFRLRPLDHALVFGRASGLRAGVGDQRAVLRDARVFFETDRVFVKRARRQVMVNFGHSKAVIGEVKRFSCGLVHDRENSNQTMTTKVTPRLSDQRPISVLRVSERAFTCSALTYTWSKEARPCAGSQLFDCQTLSSYRSCHRANQRV